MATQCALVHLVNADTKEVVYENPFVNSPLGCRPLRLAYEPESEENVLNEFHRVCAEFKALQDSGPYYSDALPPGVVVEFEDHPTMIDGKTLNTILGVPHKASCPICSAKPIEMSRKNATFRATSKAHLRHGFIILHFLLRGFDFLVTLATMRDIGCSQARGPVKQAQRAERKEEIQEDIWNEFHVKLDEVRPNGGTSTNGNMVRRLLERPDALARILDIDVELITLFRTMYMALASKLPVKKEEFKKVMFQAILQKESLHNHLILGLI